MRKLFLFALIPAALISAVGISLALRRAPQPVPKTPAEQYNAVVELVKTDYRDADAVSQLHPTERPMDKSERDESIKRLVKRLPDQWSQYVAPDEPQSELVHPGILLKSVKGDLVVDMVAAGSAAHRAGLRRGDLITAADGVTLHGTDPASAVESMRRRPGQQVKLTCTFAFHGPSFSGDIVLQYPQWPSPALTSGILPGNVFYFHFADINSDQLQATFARAAHEMFRQSHGSMSGIVLDLRNCVGGLVEMGQKLGGTFIRDGVYSYVHRRSGVETLGMEPFLGWMPGDEKETRALALRFYRAPMVVLVNESTCSAAEALAVALADNNRATLMGTTTYGKGATLATKQLDFGGTLVYVNGTNWSPKKVNYDGVGIKPSVVVEQPRNVRVDVQLRAATRRLLQMKDVPDNDDTVPMPKSNLVYNMSLASALVFIVGIGIWERRRYLRRRRASLSAGTAA